MKNNKVLFIDRDGVINQVVKNEKGEYDSPQKVDLVYLVDGIEKILAWANTNGIKVIEISNQPGAAKGKISMKILDDIEIKIDNLLKEKGVKIDYKYICYHHPKGVVPELTLDCDCRKPKPGLLLRAAKDLKIDLKNSVFLGDRDWDVLAGKAAGCKTIIYLFKQDNPEKLNYALESPADYKVWSIDEALDIIKNLLTKH